jgi:hypothetical protein
MNSSATSTTGAGFARRLGAGWASGSKAFSSPARAAAISLGVPGSRLSVTLGPRTSPAQSARMPVAFLLGEHHSASVVGERADLLRRHGLHDLADGDAPGLGILVEFEVGVAVLGKEFLVEVLSATQLGSGEAFSTGGLGLAHRAS